MTAMTNAPPLPAEPLYFQWTASGLRTSDARCGPMRYVNELEYGKLRAIATTLRDQLAEQTARADANEKDANKGRRVVGAIAIACHRLGIDFMSIQTEMHRVMKEADDNTAALAKS